MLFGRCDEGAVCGGERSVGRGVRRERRPSGERSVRRGVRQERSALGRAVSQERTQFSEKCVFVQKGALTRCTRVRAPKTSKMNLYVICTQSKYGSISLAARVRA